MSFHQATREISDFRRHREILVNKIMEKGKPVIIVNASGSAINVEADCDALIQAWYPGQYDSKALANILFGKVSFRKAACNIL